MGRRPCCEKEGVNRGAWTAMEDKLLTDHITLHGEGRWRTLPKIAGLNRCGKSCRLRWLNYLRPDIKRGNITGDEEELIIRLHKLLGNRWSLIAGRLLGRTDNEIKNYWNSNLSKKINHDDLCNNAGQNDMKRDTNSRTIANPKPHSPMVFRTKAFKCTRQVFTSPPPPPPHDPATSKALDIGHYGFLESPVIDLAMMDFGMSFNEFFSSHQLPLSKVDSDLSHETRSGGYELSLPEVPGGICSDDWMREECVFDGSLLETWLGV